MGTDRRHPPVQWIMVLACVTLLAGCVSMPDSGGVSNVSESPRADADSQVRVFGVKPRPNDDPMSLVRGFLEATTSDEVDYRTARLYLTKRQARKWNPRAGINVLANSPSPRGRSDRNDADNYRVELSGERTAWVDDNHAYAPTEGPFQTTFRLTKEKGQWRITDLPDGLILSRADFQQFYRSVNMYYFAESSVGGQNVFVPDPIYLRRRIDPLTSAVKALLAGPTDWLSPVVVSQFPKGTSLADREGIELGESGKLRVRLSERRQVGRGQCELMASQLLKTVQEQAATKVQEVELAHEDQSTACRVSGKGADLFNPQRLVSAKDQQYYLDDHHRLMILDGGRDPARPAPGPFGNPDRGGSSDQPAVGLRSVAVRLDGQVAAGVSRDGRALYIADMAEGAELGEPRLRSKAAKVDDGLTAPSWDGLGDLWVADRDRGNPRLVMLSHNGQAVTVDVPELRAGTIESVKVAPDGARIALLVREEARTTLKLGRVSRSGSVQDPQITVEQLRPVAPQLEDVVAASWAGLSRLLVVGRESQGVQQMQYVDTDGSMPFVPALPGGISTVTAVAASADQAQPLLAAAEGAIFRLPAESTWKRVASQGSSPVYPG